MHRLSFAVVLLTACAHYTPVPLDLAAGPADYASRRLDDSATTAALDSLGAPPTWTAARLATAAWWLRAERARSNAEVRAAEAALLTAGARPDPGVEAGIEQSFSGRDGTSPWAIAAGPSITFELGGKRQARIARARAGVVAAIAAQARDERLVWSRVYLAATALSQARRRLDQAETRRMLLDTLVIGIRRRFDDGTIARQEVVRAERDRQGGEAGVLNMTRERSLAEAQLAAAVGVPAKAIAGLPLDLSGTITCDRMLARGPDSLRVRALTRRPELGLAVASYLAAEADVRLAVASSWPDLVLGPGLLFDHGVGKWTLSFGIPALAANRHRGPIAEAEARRLVEAARVREAQEQLLVEVDSGVAACVWASAEASVVRRMYTAATEREAVTLDAYRRGEVGALDLAQARLLTLDVAEQRGAAQARDAEAAVFLELAVGDESARGAGATW